MTEEYRKRLADCMRRASQGGELTIGFLGGSITQGSLASDDTKTYAYQVYQWWRGSFPNAEIHYVNGGIGGTTSHFGAARAVEDLLMYQPDAVVVDFSVNDDPEPFFQETFEGVLRRILTWPSAPAVIVLNNVFYDTGVNAQEYHNEVADYYQVPHVSIRDTIYQDLQKGLYPRTEISPDGLHPNDKGHALVAGQIIRLLEEVKGMLAAEPETDLETDAAREPGIVREPDQMSAAAYGPETLPPPLTANAYQEARRLNIRNANPVLEGFRADPVEKTGHLDFFRNGWIGKRKGDRLILETECSCLAVQYRKTIHQPSPVARLVLDGQEDQAVILDGNFEETWGDCLYLQTVLHHGERKTHRIEIEITQGGEGDQTPFYLLSFIVA